jgi:hypothetical protein
MDGARRLLPAAAIAVGVVLLLVAGVVSAVAPHQLSWSVVIGVVGILAVVMVVGAPLRRRGSPRGRSGRMIGAGSGLLVAAGVSYALPPHPLVVSCLVLMLGATLFTIGVAILGGGVFGLVGAIAAGLVGAALLLEPTPVLLSHVTTPVTCQLHGANGDFTGRRDFSVDCPRGRRYTISNRHDLLFPERRVQVLADPNGLLATQYVGEHQPTADLLAGTASILAAAGVVVAAGLNRRRRHGQVRPVMRMPLQ